jgi:hypothetical protein
MGEVQGPGAKRSTSRACELQESYREALSAAAFSRRRKTSAHIIDREQS